MKPTLFTHPYIDSYPALLLLGFFFAYLLARTRAKRIGLKPSHIDNIGLIVPLAGLAGARFFARFFFAKLGIWDSLQIWKGEGLIFYGGFIMVIAALAIYALAFRLPLLKLFDCLAPSAALGLAFGRVGCFLAGCCWGDVCADVNQVAMIQDLEARERIQTIPMISRAGFPFGVTFPKKSDPYAQQVKWGLIKGSEPRSLPVHPVQLYEASLALFLCGLLCRASSRQHRDGDISLALLMGYAFIRFCTEFLRADNRLNDWGLTFSQVVSLWIAACCLIAMGLRYLSELPRAKLHIARSRDETVGDVEMALLREKD